MNIVRSALREELYARINNVKNDSFIALLATQFQVTSLKQYLLKHTAVGVLPPITIASLNRFLEILYDAVPSQKTRIDASMCEFAMHVALDRIEDASFTYYNKDNLTAASSEVLKIINELREGCISPDEFTKRARTVRIAPYEKVRELKTIYMEYLATLHTHNLVDQDGLMEDLIEQFTSAHVETLFPRVNCLIIDGFDIITPLFRKLIATLKTTFPGTIHLLFEYDPSRPRIFSFQDNTFSDLRMLADEAVEKKLPDTQDTSLHILPLHVFEDKIKILEIQQLDNHSSVLMIEADTRKDEVEHIAGWIKKTCLEKNTNDASSCDLGNIFVCFPRIELYAPLVNELFPLYGIPFSISQHKNLTQSYLVISLLRVLETVRDNYSRRSMLRLLEEPYICVSTEESNGREQCLDHAVLNTLSIKLHIIEGKDEWLNRLRAHKANLQKRLRKINNGERFEYALESDDPEEMARRIKEEVRKTSVSLQELQRLFNLLEPFEQPLQLGKACQYLLEMIEELGIGHFLRHQLTASSLTQHLQNEIAAISSFTTLLKDLAACAKSLCYTPLSVERIIDTLTQVCYRTQYSCQESQENAIHVLGGLDIRGLEADTVIIGGLNEDVFPTSPAPLLFLTESESGRIGVPRRAEWLPYERYKLYQHLTMSRKTLMLTYATREGENPLLRSCFIDEVARWCTPKKVELYREELNSFSITGQHRALGYSIRRTLFEEEYKDDAPIHELTVVSRQELDNVLSNVIALYRIRNEPEPNEYEGMLSSSFSHEYLKQRYADPHYEYSISQLEHYGRCPFSFLMNRICRILEPEQFEEVMTPLEFGSLIHRILFALLRTLKERGNQFSGDHEVQEAITLAHALVRKELKSLPYQNLHMELTREQLLGKPDVHRPGLLRQFVENEHAIFAQSELNMSPEFFEFCFGHFYESEEPRYNISYAAPYEIKGEHGTIRLRGKIDRIDTSSDSFLVIDYKTSGSTPTINELQRGTSLQLPIYLLAAEQFLARIGKRELRPLGACYSMVRAENNVRREQFLILKGHIGMLGRKGIRKGVVDNAELREHLETAKVWVRRHAEAIIRGAFYAFSDQGKAYISPCTYCEYKYICRVDYEKISNWKHRGQHAIREPEI